ncbi:hypothetical protein [Erwinia sorbitola]|uniref:hypothetical protein n=1 Tax=Erwinia sorbitola TaxID=2681984 RepID=UPI001E551423|nr:hypothetical protein [Erwinia sorbitola]
MKMKNSLAVAALLLSCTAHAGWYVVDNYEGTLGKWPVHISLQEYDSYGSGLNIKGSYYYDKYRAPIPLYGKRSADSFELCEVNTPAEYDSALIQGSKGKVDTHICPFSLTRQGDKLRGHWQQGDKRYEVALKQTASLDNTAEGKITGKRVDIPFWGQTATHSFIGHYQTTADGIAINSISVINKKTGNSDQTLDPQLHQCQFGFYMTAIYQNIESDQAGKTIWLNCYSQQADITVGYHFDKASMRYITSE